MNVSSHRQRNALATQLSLPAAVGVSLLVFAGAALLLLLLAAVISYSQKDPGSFSLPASLFALYTAAMLGGMTAGRLSPAPLAAGGIYGTVCFVLTFLLSVLPLGTATCGFTVFAALLARTGVIGAGMLGAFLGKKREKRHSSRRTQHRR